MQTENWSHSQLWIGIAFGLAVFLGIILFGKTSGAHMNPAVTIALWAKHAFRGKDVPSYILFQFSGAVAASACLAMIYPEHLHYGDTLPTTGVWQSFGTEFGITCLLMLGVIFDFHSNSSILQAGFLIGSIVGLEAYFAGPYCGASMNPARSLAPAVFSGMWGTVWIYLLSTVFGAVSAVLIFKRKH